MIVLVGFMGAGKSTVGRLVAAKTGLPFVDTDELVAARAGAPIARVFEERGERAFRALERAVVEEVLDGPEAVVALGGGAVTHPQTCTDLQWANVVHLEVSFAEARRRLRGTTDRPLLAGPDPKTLFDRRKQLYRDVADHALATDGLTPEEVALEVVARLSVGPARDLHRVVVPLPGRAYDVVVGDRIYDRAGDLIPLPDDAENAFVVTHPSLRERCSALVAALEAAGPRVVVLSAPEGEAAKSLDVAASLYDAIAAAGGHRHDVVVAFGGGALCDVAGFVASTYARGMTLVHVPTTLLAQVDAAVGGKTAVNIQRGKNLVGTWHQPVAVLCDVSVLDGLPDAEVVSGLAEVAKYGFISDPALLDLVERQAGDVVARDRALLTEVVLRSVSIKAAVVAADERERGRRAVLNYGHTFGHAIERVRGMRHGEAVSLGMMAAAYLAEELGLLKTAGVERHRTVLEAAGLPVSAELDPAALRDAWRLDKKYRRGVRFVLLRDLGDAVYGVEADEPSVERAVRRLAS